MGAELNLTETAREQMEHEQGSESGEADESVSAGDEDHAGGRSVGGKAGFHRRADIVGDELTGATVWRGWV